MKAFRKLYEAEKFDTIKEYINSAIKKFPNNKAFIIKNKNSKEISGMSAFSYRFSMFST